MLHAGGGKLCGASTPGFAGSRWFTETIYNWFFEGGNWNRGAAYALVLLVLCMLVVLAALRLFRVNLADVAK